MADVNFVEYGTNALRLPNSAFDLMQFLSQNGYYLGVLLAFLIITGLTLFLLFWVWKNFRRVF